MLQRRRCAMAARVLIWWTAALTMADLVRIEGAIARLRDLSLEELRNEGPVS